MPTPAKLVAALAMAAVGWATVEALLRFALLSEGVIGYGREVAALVGLVLGWRILGRAATGPRGRGDDPMRGMVAGVGAAFALLVATVVIHALWTVMDAALAQQWRSPERALEGFAEQIMADAGLFAEPRALGVLFGGGALAGLAAGVTGRIWW